MRDHQNGALERGERLLEGLGRGEVEVVGRLVEQQHVVRAAQQELEGELLSSH
ncbi:hypothetical protein [Pseudonocardia adelaidensis]|uniref:hypothetical protein n=1 Tax=Pseudonocardia adelaidensis TaxID=648754 RepID=UPI0031E5A087